MAERGTCFGHELRSALDYERMLAEFHEIRLVFPEFTNTPAHQARAIDHIGYSRDMQRFAVTHQMDGMRICEQLQERRAGKLMPGGVKIGGETVDARACFAPQLCTAERCHHFPREFQPRKHLRQIAVIACLARFVELKLQDEIRYALRKHYGGDKRVVHYDNHVRRPPR